MPESTLEQDMALTFAALSASAARNRLFAKKAGTAGARYTALLLDALAEGEEIMARRALSSLRGKVTDLGAHLEEISGAKKRFAGQCTRRAERAADRKEDGTADTYKRFAAVLENHGERLAGEEDQRDAALHVCRVCGYVAAGQVPERCPVCNAVSEKFKTIEP